MSFLFRTGPARLLALLLATRAPLAVADAADAQTTAAVPPPACVAPKIVERASVAAADTAHLQQLAADYGHCMKAYIDACQVAAEAATAQATADVDAANAAAHQVNDLYAAVKAYAAKHAKD